MTTTEDAVRAATRAYGETVTEIRPLDLTRPAPRTRPRRPRRFPAWVAPVTAAAAVIALAISLVLVRGIPNGPVVPAKRPAPAGGAVPRYYANPVAAGKNAWLDLAIGDLFTGARLRHHSAARRQHLRQRDGRRGRQDVRRRHHADQA